MAETNKPKQGRPPKPKEVKAETVEQAGTEIVKTKNKSRGLSGVEQNTSAKAEDVSRILANCLQWYKMPKVKNEQELEERIGQFFVECINTGQIPTVEKMCLAIGYDRQTVWRWENGERSSVLGPRAGEKDGKNTLPDIITHNESRMALKHITLVKRDVDDAYSEMLAIFDSTKAPEKKGVTPVHKSDDRERKLKGGHADEA